MKSKKQPMIKHLQTIQGKQSSFQSQNSLGSKSGGGSPISRQSKQEQASFRRMTSTDSYNLKVIQINSSRNRRISINTSDKVIEESLSKRKSESSPMLQFDNDRRADKVPKQFSLHSVDEQIELPPDPKVKKFGRPPCPPIKVRFEYVPEPTQLLEEITEFIFQHAKMMVFSEEKQDFWKTIVSAVLSTSSYEHQIFRANLDELIKENIQETGYDPRINGPPEHIAAQVVQKLTDLSHNDGSIVNKILPHHQSKTISISRKQTIQNFSEISRIKKLDRNEQVIKLCSQNENSFQRLVKMQKFLSKMLSVTKPLKVKPQIELSNQDLIKSQTSKQNSSRQPLSPLIQTRSPLKPLSNTQGKQGSPKPFSPKSCKPLSQTKIMMETLTTAQSMPNFSTYKGFTSWMESACKSLPKPKKKKRIQIEIQPRQMMFLKTQNFSFSRKEIEQHKRARMTALNGRTLPPRPPTASQVHPKSRKNIIKMLKLQGNVQHQISNVNSMLLLLNE